MRQLFRITNPYTHSSRLGRLCFRRLYGNGGKLSKPDVLDGLVEERFGNIAHVALVVNIYESESGVVDGQLDGLNSSAKRTSRIIACQ